jgi:3' terminal RNA ribose 2'-O-methyltransferase Hen1
VDRLSDVDLAVEGLPPSSGVFAQAARELRGKVDIVPMEGANAELRWGILRRRLLVPRINTSLRQARPSPPLPQSLAGQRVRVAADLIRAVAPRSVIDFGCGEGWLLAELAMDPGIERLTGVDFNERSLQGARQRLRRSLGPDQRTRATLLAGLVTWRDPRFKGHDTAAALEVVEHLEPPQLRAFIQMALSHTQPKRMILTTPNADYNRVWGLHLPKQRRHPDHRFEWSRQEFAAWAEGVAARHGYSCSLHPVGPTDLRLGAPTQLAVFDRCDRETLAAGPRAEKLNSALEGKRWSGV